MGQPEAEAHRPRIGELLIQKGIINQRQLNQALEAQKRSGERLGQILIALGYVQRKELYRILAELWDTPFVLLGSEQTFDEKVARKWPLRYAMRHQAVLIRKDGDTIEVAIADRPSAALETKLKRVFRAGKIRWLTTTEWDIDRAIRTVYHETLLYRSIYTLYSHNVGESAHTVFTVNQYLAVGILITGTLLLLYFYPTSTIIAVNLIINFLFLASIGFKFFSSAAGARTEQFKPVSDVEVRALKDDDLPTYTILVPVYKEANIVQLMMRNLLALEYPTGKLEILVLVEEDDPETQQALEKTNLPDHVEIVRVPHGQPKTKPKACNIGLYFARGEYLVIYDAEDLPEPDQLKKAVVAMRKGPPNQICVQAALNYFNTDDNLLTKLFTLEYSYWFDYMLPGLYRMGLPIPLGGTSNHFSTEALRDLGGWDPFNVTEDADLGIRASMRRYEIGVINSTTFEEANSRLGNWIRQRSRWIKGYMQTALVHGRNPIRLIRQIGLKRALGFALLIGGTPITFLLLPILYAIFFFWLFARPELLGPYFPPMVMTIALVNLLAGNAMAIYLNMMAVFRRRSYELVWYALLNPLYWILHSIAAYKALWQLFTNPFFWEKTQHGISEVMQHDLSKRPAV